MSQKSKRSRGSMKLKSDEMDVFSQQAVIKKQSIKAAAEINSKRSSVSKSFKNKLPYYQKAILSYSGFILAFCATVYLTTSYYLIKLSKVLNASDMGTIQFAITMICCLMTAVYYKQNVLGPRESRLLLLGRGFAGSVALTLNFFSIKFMGYGDSTSVRNIAPVVTAVFAKVFLKEHLNLSYYISLVVSLAGVLFISRPPFIFGSLLNSSSIAANGMFYLVFGLALLSTTAIGSAIVLIKKLTTKEIHFSVIILYLSTIGTAICTLVSVILYASGASHTAWNHEKQFVYRDIGLAVLAGFANYLGHICFTLALLRENSNTISAMRILDIVLAFLLEYVVMSLRPDLFSSIGATLVITSVVVVVVYKVITKKSLKKKQQKAVEEKSVFRI